MEQHIWSPTEIENESMRIIEQELGERELGLDEAPVIKRVIHTTADFAYADNLYFSTNAVAVAIDALKSGCHIVCDTNMAKAGINRSILKRLGGDLHCFMADEEVAAEALQRGVTRASVSVEKAAGLQVPLIFAVGNAPTALLRLKQLIDEGDVTPVLVVAAPVGFVNVVEAKELFVNAGIPAIVARGRKGGSPVAAAICNALLYTACPRG